MRSSKCEVQVGSVAESLGKMENLRELGPRVMRQVYLITYARANAQLCAGRREFAGDRLQQWSPEAKTLGGVQRATKRTFNKH